MTRSADIFEIPDRVHHGDFVLKLTEGVDRADETLRNYVVTPRWNGQSLSSGQLAKVYGFTDVDGSRPDAGVT